MKCDTQPLIQRQVLALHVAHGVRHQIRALEPILDHCLCVMVWGLMFGLVCYGLGFNVWIQRFGVWVLFRVNFDWLGVWGW